MSESMPERSGGGSVFTRKMGPLPAWGWMAIVLLLAVFYAMYSKQKKAAASSSSSNTDASSVNSPGGVDASLVPQFVNQTYVQGTPPPAPNVTINNTTPPPSSTPPTGTNKVNLYPAPQGLSAAKASNTSLKVSWNNITSPMPAPQSYTVAIYDKAGKTVSQQTVNAPDSTGGKSTATITGLPANAAGLQVHVWANGGAKAPQHASSTVNL
jgi:hypothetical protein